jgi:hypothetical protein
MRRAEAIGLRFEKIKRRKMGRIIGHIAHVDGLILGLVVEAVLTTVQSRRSFAGKR